jgi:hypothetical protein
MSDGAWSNPPPARLPQSEVEEEVERSIEGFLRIAFADQEIVADSWHAIGPAAIGTWIDRFRRGEFDCKITWT